MKKDPDEAEKILVMSVTNIIYNSKKKENKDDVNIYHSDRV